MTTPNPQLITKLRVGLAVAEDPTLEWEYRLLPHYEWRVADERTRAASSMIHGYSLRLKPAPVWSLPAPPEGREWHKSEGWTQDMLPEGYRPLLDGEKPEADDQVWEFGTGPWVKTDGNERCGRHNHTRTKRPLPPLPRPWSRAEDVPKVKEVIWFRLMGQSEWAGQLCLIYPEGVCIHVRVEEAPRAYLWSELCSLEYSIDGRQTFHECVTTNPLTQSDI